jgi:multisubunit Na+/H+ antiporter MnhB subunit
MRVLMRAIAVLFVAIAAFLVYAVIHAAASEGGAKTGVAIGYIIGAIVLTAAAAYLWRRPAGRNSGAGTGTGAGV